MDAVARFDALAAEDRFKGWPVVVGEVEDGVKIPFFGRTINYQLKTGNGVENYTSIIRHFGWAVVFGLTRNQEVITLVQWKPGVNQASWELPPGGIGKIASDATQEEIRLRTEAAFLKETGFGFGVVWFEHLGRIAIETGKYRGAGQNDHGLYAHLFLARDLVQVSEARQSNPNEIMETILVPLGEFRGVLESGRFVEESAVACAYKALTALDVLRWS